MEDSTNRIVAPPELKNFYTYRGFREELLQYSMPKLTSTGPPLKEKYVFRDDGRFRPDPRTEVNESVDYSVQPRKVKLQQEAAARGLKK